MLKIYKKHIFQKLMFCCSICLICVAGKTTLAADQLDCSIVDDVSESMMQIHQSGFDVNQAEINEQALDQKQIFIVKGVIQDIQSMPIFGNTADLEAEYIKLINKWKNVCNKEIVGNLKEQK